MDSKRKNVAAVPSVRRRANRGRQLVAYVATALSLVIICGLFGTGCRDDVPKKAQAHAPSAARDLSASRASPGNKVLLVHSYHPEYEWVAGITRGVKRALGRSSLDMQTYYMDTKRNTAKEWKEQAGESALKVVREWQPDVVIAADDNAQEYFAKHLAGLAKPQVVFCGVNAEPEAYGYPAKNITGVLERPHFAASLRLLKKLQPQAKRIALLTDESPTSTAVVEYMKKQKTEFEIVACDMPATFKEWKTAVRRYQTMADAIAIYTYHTVMSEGSDESMVPGDIMAWTVANTKLPLVGFIGFALDDGCLCGYVESGVEQGFTAGQIARELLDGKKAADIPLVTALEGQSMLNLKTARRMGIEVPDSLLKTTDIVVED